jgi:5-methyltetrahydropteroyltriglutamate--homocysteine methyltransferase
VVDASVGAALTLVHGVDAMHQPSKVNACLWGGAPSLVRTNSVNSMWAPPYVGALVHQVTAAVWGAPCCMNNGGPALNNACICPNPRSCKTHPMFQTAIAGSLPKPAWLAETEKLWPQWKAAGPELDAAKADATLLWIKEQEDAGLSTVGDGEQARQHFVHGFVERVQGIDFVNKVKMGIRNNRYDAMVPQVVSALSLTGRVHAMEARLARAHTKHKLKFTLPGPMTIVDTVADRHYGNREALAMAFAALLNQEALALQADGVDIIQFDEPAFNVYMQDAADWGVRALERAAQGLTCTTAVHICYGYGIQANIDWKNTLGDQWRQYEQVFPALAAQGGLKFEVQH